MDKSNKKYPLTIGIPTYNRPNEVDRLLKSVVPQLTPEVEVLIRDDSPDERTAEVVKKHFPKLSNQVVYSHGERLGIDGGELYVVEHGRGDYVWTFGDDDEMAPGGIAYVLDLVRKHPEITFAWANYRGFSKTNPAFDLGGSKFFADGNDALGTLQNLLGQISTFIFKREVAMQVMPLAKQQNGSWWSILVPVLHAFSQPSGRFYFVQGPYVINHPPTEEEIKGIGFHDNGFKVFGVNLYNIYKLFDGKFDRKVIRKLLRRNFGSVWRGVVVGTVRGNETTHGKLAQMFKLYWSYPECWIAAPIFILPRPVIILLYRIYKFFVKHNFRDKG